MIVMLSLLGCFLWVDFGKGDDVRAARRTDSGADTADTGDTAADTAEDSGDSAEDSGA